MIISKANKVNPKLQHRKEFVLWCAVKILPILLMLQC